MAQVVIARLSGRYSLRRLPTLSYRSCPVECDDCRDHFKRSI